MQDLNRDNLKNLLIYGVCYSKYDSTDINSDIISNIRMRFLQSKKSASNKLYRSANGDSLVYSYNFTVDKPLQWKVTRNRKTIEVIEHLTADKYCINYYDMNGKDIKKVLFNSHHNWFKTNYYNHDVNDDLVCSLVPKEFEKGTAILKYMTGAVYPERLFSCCIPSCDEVRNRLFSMYPVPEVSALTQNGVVYFLAEADKKVYEELLLKIENEYASENAPEVYVSEEDVKGGFNLNVVDFDMNKNLNRSFDISLAESFNVDAQDASDIRNLEPKVEITNEVSVKPEAYDKPIESDTVNEAISEVVDRINACTSLGIDADEILNFDISNIENESSEEEATDQEYISFEDNDPAIDEKLKHIDSVLDGSSLLTSDKHLIIGNTVVDDDYISSIIDGIMSSAFSKDLAYEADEVKPQVDDITAEDNIVSDNTEISSEELAVDSKDIIEDGIPVYEPAAYVVSHEPKSNTALAVELNDPLSEYHSDELDELNSIEDVIESIDETENKTDLSVDESAFLVGTTAEYISDTPADMQIESRGETYYYYGDVDSDGKRNGRGRTLMSDGSIAYEGEYADDMRNGLGSFYFKDGSLCYWGRWNNNIRQGFGMGISSDDKAVHIGSFNDNKPSGIGVRFDSSGNFVFASSNCEDKKKGITISGLSENSFTVRVWSEKDEAYIQREFNINDLL